MVYIYIYINHLGSWFTIMAIARGNTDNLNRCKSTNNNRNTVLLMW